MSTNLNNGEFVNDDVDSDGNDVDVSPGIQRDSNQINDDPIEYYKYGVRYLSLQ